MSLRTFIISVLMLFGGIAANADTLNLAIWDYSRLEDIKNNPDLAKDRRELINQAHSYLFQEPVTVTNKSWSFVKNKHYYVSMAPYWWPEEKDGKIIYVRRDGQVNPESQQLDKNKIAILADRLSRFSIAFFLTEDIKYYEAFVQQLDAWFIKRRTKMYPNFMYSQIVPDQGEVTGRPIGVIEGYPLNSVLDAIRLIDYRKSIGQRRMKKIATWFQQLEEWLLESEMGKSISTSNSNSGVAYDSMLLNISLFIGDEECAQNVVKQFPAKRIYEQIESDGKMPAELARTKAFEYSVYNLQYFFSFLTAAQSAGLSVYNDNKARIDSAIEYLNHFVSSHEVFPFQQITDWRAQEVRFYRLVASYQRLNPTIVDELHIDSEELERNLQGWLFY